MNINSRVCACVWWYVSIYTCIYMYVCVSMYTCDCLYIYICIRVYYAYQQSHARVRAHAHWYTHTHVYTHTHAHARTRTHTHLHGLTLSATCVVSPLSNLSPYSMSTTNQPPSFPIVSPLLHINRPTFHHPCVGVVNPEHRSRATFDRCSWGGWFFVWSFVVLFWSCVCVCDLFLFDNADPSP